MNYNLFKTAFVILGEYLAYCFHHNMQKTIINIADKLSEINVVYVKFLQAISADSHIIDLELKNKLNKYTDDVSYTDDDIDYSFLKLIQESGLFLRNNKPINSGLIALVFKAYDKNGKAYAVKVKRLHIYKKVIENVREIEQIVNYLMGYEYFRKINIKKKFIDNKFILFQQLDFENEVENMKLFENNFKNIDYVVIPHVYEEYTQKNNNVIVMDFIDGDKLDDILEEDKSIYCKLMAKFGLKTLFFDGIYHSDLHKGNILFIRDTPHTENATTVNEGSPPDLSYKLGIIDFGIIGKVTREHQNIFYEFIKMTYEKDFYNAASYMFDNIFEPQEKKDDISLNNKNILIQNIANIFERTICETKCASSKEIYEINNYLGEYELEISNFFSEIQIALLVNDRLCNALSIEGAFLDIYGEELLKL